MSQAESKHTPKRASTAIVAANGLTLDERMSAIRLATHEAHEARIRQARDAFEQRLVDMIACRAHAVLDGLVGE
jgi:hypothetical protein